MKNKNLLIFLIFLLSFSSCINYNQVTTIKTDKSGKMYVHYWMDINPELDSLLITKLGLFNKDTLTINFHQNFVEINYINVYHNFEDSTLHTHIEFEFASFDSLNLLPFFKHSEFSVKDGPDETQIFSQYIQPITSGFGLTYKDIDIKYTYYLPGEIIRHNANSLSRNKLTWKLSTAEIAKGKTISASYVPFKLKETPKWIYYLASLVILIVLFFLLKKSKK